MGIYPHGSADLAKYCSLFPLCPPRTTHLSNHIIFPFFLFCLNILFVFIIFIFSHFCDVFSNVDFDSFIIIIIVNKFDSKEGHVC